MTRGHDVQLEHGYTRTANRLEEAMLDADFTGAQFKILRGLVRLTYGWRRKTVTISVPDLAHKLRLSPTGGFRRALTDLVREGVILCLDKGTGGHASTYAIQKDFTAWGRYSVAPGRLASIWDERPPSHDTLMTIRDERPATPDDSDPDTGAPDDGVTSAEGDPMGSRNMTLQGKESLPYGVTPTWPNSDTPSHLDPPKERKERKDNTLSSRVREELLARCDSPSAPHVVDAFLRALPPGQSELTWVGRLSAWLDGLDLPHGRPKPVPRILLDALRDFPLSNAPLTPANLFAWYDRAEREAAKAGNVAAPVEDALRGRADRLVRLLVAEGFARPMPVEMLRSKIDLLVAGGRVRDGTRFFAEVMAAEPWSWDERERGGRLIERVARALAALPPAEEQAA